MPLYSFWVVGYSLLANATGNRLLSSVGDPMSVQAPAPWSSVPCTVFRGQTAVVSIFYTNTVTPSLPAQKNTALAGIHLLV